MKKVRKNSALLAVVVCLVVLGQVTAQPSPFVIRGWVTANGEPCINPGVEITNVNRSETWRAETRVASNYYQLVLDSDCVDADTVLHIEASGCSQSTTVEHTVTQEDMDTGGFIGNISLEAAQEIIWQGDITLTHGTTFNVTAHNSGKSYVLNRTTALGALDTASEKGDFNYTVSDEWYVRYGSLLVDSIADIPGVGLDGWMYWVNYPEEPMPMVSVNQYELEDGDVVTFYWSSSMGMTPENSSKVLIFNVTVLPLFDTGKGTYPSISGTHRGTIIPDQNGIVKGIYTYPCAGTGGHTERVTIWNETLGECAVAEWSGYAGDYHNLSFNTTLTFKEGVMYHYTIETGSYPQIIHASSKQVTGGTITCTRFVDANGKVYTDWIPAIRLW
jgi:hypothetical protein